MSEEIDSCSNRPLFATGTITLKLHNITSYMKKVGERTESPPLQVAGIGWRVLAYPSVVDKITRLSCFLVGESPSMWTAWVDADFRIVKKNGGGGFGNEESFRRMLMGKEPHADEWGWKEFVTSKKLLSAACGFVVDDSVEIQVDFSVSDVCGASLHVFDIPGALAADIKLKVGDSVFYANKGYLSVVSSVFRDMFALTDAAEGKKEKEIELKDLDAKEFKEFLGVIYPTRYPITDANVVSLFRIANRYNAQRMIADCERHLLPSSKVPTCLVADADGALFNAFETAGALTADIRLKVGDSIFYANKGYLSVVSSVFRGLFAKTETAAGDKVTEEIELKDLNANEFKEFLGVVYPTRYPITDANVLSLFRIADRYDVKRVIADCEYHLFGANSVPWFDKLKLAADLNRRHLKASLCGDNVDLGQPLPCPPKHLISKMTCEDIQAVNQNENKKQLGMDALEALMDEHIHICRR